jgi:hypothetical protein
MIAAHGRRRPGGWLAILALIAALGSTAPALAQQAPDPPASDLLNAVLWMHAHVARSYRVLLNAGDNFGDFVDEYRGTERERLKVLEQHKDRWGREWIMIANPASGSFESAPVGHDFKLSDGERRRLKRGVLDAWPGP